LSYEIHISEVLFEDPLSEGVPGFNKHGEYGSPMSHYK
jgi:hypothetical protein